MDRLEEIRAHKCLDNLCGCCACVPYLLELVNASDKALFKAGLEVGRLLLRVRELEVFEKIFYDIQAGGQKISSGDQES